MQTPLERAELVSQLLGELRGADGATTPHRGLTLFARAVLRRADDRYLYRHRLTTLSAQLRDTYRWAMAAMGSRDVVVRVFQPTIQRHGYSIEDGWILETVMPDQPFIFDTLQLFMEQREIKVLNTLRIILPVRLTNDGELGSVDANSEGAENFSYTRWYIQLPAGPGAGDVAAGIERRLTLARTMVRDFHRMIRDIAAVANEFEYLATLERDSYDDCLEIRDFLQWLSADTFVFSGLSCYRRLDDGRCERVPARGLGVAPDGDGGDEDDASALAFFGDSEAPRWPLARVRKSAADSIIHRSGKVDEVLVRTFDQDGRPNGGIVIHGMFTFKGLGQPGGTIPILRRKLDSIAAAEGTVRASYDHKGLVHAYNALPVEYLFEADADTVRELIWMTVRADSAHDIRSHIVGDSSSRSAYAFVVMPKENFSDDLRAQLQDLLLERLDANYADHRIHLGKFGSVALHFYLTGSHGFGDIDLRAVERDLVEAGTPWRMRLRRALQQAYPDAVEEAARRFDQWACAFGEGYTEHTHPADAVVDIDHLQQVLANGATRFDLRPDPSDRDVATLSIYSIEPLMLTAILPVVDQLGVVVAEQHAFTIRRAPTLTVNTLRVLRGDPDILDQRDNLVRALGAVFARRMRSDRLNRILIPARLGWRKVDVLRAYHNYSRQLGHQATTEMVQKTLIVHASYTRNLADLFHVRFDPAQPYDETTRAERERQLVGDLLDYLDDVNSYEEDRILRTFLDLIRATVRTSFYRRHDDGVDHYLSLKLDCARVHEMPAPRPLYEVYVHHAEFEGVHLRAGRVARGGIRWSDRQDDYRTEVLGLLATQVLKTTLTVPTGAKGGFVLKAPPDDWAEARRKADVAYRVFIRGLLDVTDNITAGRVVPPPQVRRFDGDDPYLVVAADKGTTHLADTANAIAAEYGFWLGDAFASGGSMGLDKRGVGIGALGVWVAVKRHFLELSVDPERDPVTVVGIGDMSGDLFGHGMLLSRTLRLVGAFDQRHVFVDPEPDPVVSFAERQRLFDRGRSTWRDYDPAAISPGGGVWDRGAKSIPLSPEVRARLGTRRAEVSGEALVRLLLQADVDLLWNGGVGTYIKASSEAHADVGDATNDRVRVDARQVRFRVIGEGGNLGITMAGRVELSGRGARVNLDAVDNCAGVALNDREVNLKTLLNPVVRAGGLTRAQRDQLLTEVAAGIRAAVLEDNDAQCLAISLDCVRSAHDPWAFFHASEFLEDEIYFSRRDEQLPDTQETVEQRLARGQGYLRPELAKLLCFSKQYAHKRLNNHPSGGRRALRPFLESYFPPAVVDAYPDAIDRHILYTSIAATAQINRIVDYAGVTFFPATIQATDRPAHQVAAAYLLIEPLIQAAPLRDELRANGTSPMQPRYAALIELETQLARAARGLLWNTHGPVSLDDGANLDGLGGVLGTLTAGIEEVLPERARQSLRERSQQWFHRGLDAPTARRLASLAWIGHAGTVQRLCKATGGCPAEVARRYFELGSESLILDLAAKANEQAYPDRWDAIAVPTVERGLLASLSRMAERHFREANDLPASRWLRAHGLGRTADRIRRILRERVPLSALLVTSERIKLRLDRLAS